MTDNSFGKRIKAMMVMRGFQTQGALAEAAKIHPSTLSRIINNRYNPTQEEIRAIREALDWDDQGDVALHMLSNDRK